MRTPQNRGGLSGFLFSAIAHLARDGEVVFLVDADYEAAQQFRRHHQERGNRVVVSVSRSIPR